MSPIESIEMWALRIPFKLTFKHAAAARAVSESVWVEAKDVSGLTGFGEACPRPYVTSENLPSCARAFSRWRESLLRRVDSVADLESWVAAQNAEIDSAPAAWCAIELALLDLFARQQQRPIESLFHLPPLSGEFTYSAILGDQDAPAFEAQLYRYLRLGFTSFKIKLARDPNENRRKTEILASAGVTREQTRADANNLWATAAESIAELRILANHISAIEEPINARDFEGMRRIAAATALPIILDESFLRPDDFKSIEADPQKWIINLRVSKMGGLFRSREITARAFATGVRLIIGAQVGETALLTRAALAIANFARPLLVAQEGAFGDHLLENDTTIPSLTFGPGGALAAQKVPSVLLINRPTQFLTKI